jgi:hypothetical protein
MGGEEEYDSLDERWVQRGKLESSPQAQWGNSLRQKVNQKRAREAEIGMRRTRDAMLGRTFLF